MASHLLEKSLINKIIKKLNELTLYAYENSDYYKELYSEGVVEIKSIEDMKKLPFVYRHELQKYYPFGHLCVDVHNIHAYFETTGSTGNPLAVMPNLDAKKMKIFGEFLDYWMGLKNSHVKLAMVALPYEMNPMGLKYHFGLSEIGITIIPVSVRTFLCPSMKLIKLIQDLKPELLVGRPLEIMRYAEAMNSIGYNSEECSIRKIFLTGETMSHAKWDRISKLYGGAEIYSTYGLTELDTGLISCSDYKYHLPHSPNIIVEVLNENGELVKENELGEIVITNLEKNYAPLIRYKTGDVGRYCNMCNCIMDTPHVEILGRAVDGKNIDGVDLFPVQIEEILFQNDELGCEYQLVVENNKLEIHIEKSYNCEIDNDELIGKIKKQLERELKIIPKVVIYEFNCLADKFGIAKAKGCRFIDVTNLSEKDKNKALKINICDGDDLM